MIQKNPFQVLGLNPDFVRELSDDELDKLVKLQYRGLQSIFHPDKKGDEKRSREINEAYDLLTDSDKDIFQYFKKNFLKKISLKEKISNLEKEVALLSCKNDDFYKQFVSYLASFVGFENEQTVFNIAPCKLKMYDYGKSLDLPDFYKVSKKKMSSAGLFYDMIVGEDESLIRVNGNRNIKLDRKLFGTIDQKTSNENGGIKNIIRKFQEIWSVDDEKIRRIEIIYNRGVYEPREIKKYDEKIRLYEFQEIMPLITPKIAKHSYLFSIFKEEEIFFKLEGGILNIEKLK